MEIKDENVAKEVVTDYIKLEPNSQCLAVLTSEYESNFLFPKVVKSEIKLDHDKAEFKIANVKQEPSVHYVLVLPSDSVDNAEAVLPNPIKAEPEPIKIKKCSVEVTKLEMKELSLYEEVIFGRYLSALRFLSSSSYEFTGNQQNEEKTYSCKLCRTTFKHLSSLKVHSCNRNRKNRTTKCEYCKKDFQTLDSLRQHIAIHLKEMKEPCDICGKIMVKARLPQHKRDSHFTRKKFKCDLCSIKTKEKFHLERHMMSHYKPFECEICQTKFSELRYFNEHKLNHKKPNPFKCKKCFKGYTRLTSLSRHMQTAHSKARNFACKQCKYRGKTQDDLTTHIKSHTRAYKCNLCPRKFSRSTLLKEHRMLHDNPKAFQCKICQKYYKQSKVLRKHMKLSC